MTNSPIKKSQAAAQAPAVSIVMPSFNQVAFIESAIQSVLAQSHEDFELIVMDGGSTDGTLQVLERLSLHAGGRLKWFSEADRGPAHAINKAFRTARGDIVGWLNSDDMYHADALKRAVRHFKQHPGHLMVFGAGQHIDMHGNALQAYPSGVLPIDIATWREGCPVCQPTVFLRREVFAEIGFLDESLRTAFDYDFWLRISASFSQRMGYVDDFQAYSRLHPACLTMRLRSDVAIEGMKITAHTFGNASPNWFYTYLDEFFARYPHVDEPVKPRAYLQRLIDAASRYLSSNDLIAFNARLQADRRLALLHDDGCVSIYADGWMGDSGVLRLRAQETKWRKVVLHCRNAHPHGAQLSIALMLPDGRKSYIEVPGSNPFQIAISLPENYTAPAYWSFPIQVEGAFIPAEIETGSTDMRKLGFLVEQLRLE